MSDRDIGGKGKGLCSGYSLQTAEFFPGIGLARAALDRCGIQTVFANDIDKTKAALYQADWGSGELQVA